MNPSNVSTTKKYWGQGKYSNVCLHLDKRVGALLKQTAIGMKKSAGSLASEAITYYLANLHKQAKAEEKAFLAKETALLQTLWEERARKKTPCTRKEWHKKYPHKPYPINVSK
jgi:hypothetical protein